MFLGSKNMILIVDVLVRVLGSFTLGKIVWLTIVLISKLFLHPSKSWLERDFP